MFWQNLPIFYCSQTWNIVYYFICTPCWRSEGEVTTGVRLEIQVYLFSFNQLYCWLQKAKLKLGFEIGKSAIRNSNSVTFSSLKSHGLNCKKAHKSCNNCFGYYLHQIIKSVVTLEYLPIPIEQHKFIYK